VDQMNKHRQCPISFLLLDMEILRFSARKTRMRETGLEPKAVEILLDE